MRPRRVPTPIFQGSLTCLNFGYPYRARPCGECLLNDFVPEARRSEASPRHHIPVGDECETVEEVELRDDRQLLEEKLKAWLRGRIREIEIERAEAGPRIY